MFLLIIAVMKDSMVTVREWRADRQRCPVLVKERFNTRKAPYPVGLDNANSRLAHKGW